MSFLVTTTRRAFTTSTRFAPTRVPSRKMHIRSIPMWQGSGNNYAYLVTDEKTKEAVIIDPANPPEVLPVLKEEIGKGIKLTNIINTHHHHDHAGGNAELLKHYPVPIIGGKDCAHVSNTPSHNSSFDVGSGIKVTALHTPCHTQDSISYYCESDGSRAVFTGDTLFIAGSGRFFEGSPSQMNTALNQVLAALPDDTKVYPGHEYTSNNVKFAVTVDPDNADLKKLGDYAQANRETQGKFTIGDEKKYNPFMRVSDPTIRKATGTSTDVDTMARLREMKNAS